MNLSDTDINDMSIIRACLLVTIGALLLQAYLILTAPPVYWWENWFVRGNDPEWTVMMVGLGFIALISYMVFLFKLHKLFKTDVKERLFGWSIFFGIFSFAVPLLHFIDIPVSLLEFNVAISIGFGTVIAHRILLGAAFSEAFSKRVKRLVGLSVAFKILCLSVLVFLMTVIMQGRMTWRQSWLDHVAWDIFFLIPIFGPPWDTPTLTNILLVADLIVFSTILIFGFWNLPRKVMEKTELQKLADRH